MPIDATFRKRQITDLGLDSLQDGTTVVRTQAVGIKTGEVRLSITAVNANGNVDSAFGGDGLMVVSGRVEGSATDNLGRITYVADGLVQRRLYTGDPDPSFGGGGSVPLPDGFASTTTSIALTNSGGVVAADPDSGRFVRLTAAGLPDPTFGSGGTATIPLAAGNDLILRRTSSNALYFLRELQLANPSAPSTLGLGRLSPSGQSDPGFSGDGIATFGNATPAGFAVDSMERALLPAGSQRRAMSIIRLDAAGGRDETLAPGGKARIRFPERTAGASAVAADSAAGIVVAGGAERRHGRGKVGLAIAYLRP